MGLAIGALDSGLAVIASEHSAIGWKCLAGIEILAAFTFVKFFFARGREFQKNVDWVPISNTQTFRGKEAIAKVTLGAPFVNFSF